MYRSPPTVRDHSNSIVLNERGPITRRLCNHMWAPFVAASKKSAGDTKFRRFVLTIGFTRTLPDHSCRWKGFRSKLFAESIAQSPRGNLTSPFVVKYVPVNYPFRFSGLVTTLTARRVQHRVGPGLICQPEPRPGIKTHSSPRRFSNCALHPFSFPLSRYCTGPPSCLRPLGKLHLLPAGPLVPPTDTTWPVREMPQRDRRLLFARRLGSAVSSAVRPCVDLCQ
jgi:hypothetical protein